MMLINMMSPILQNSAVKGAAGIIYRIIDDNTQVSCQQWLLFYCQHSHFFEFECTQTAVLGPGEITIVIDARSRLNGRFDYFSQAVF